MTTIHVTCSLAIRGPLVLMGKRLPNKMRPELWEYPGGKLEPDETYEAALKRELEEELGVIAKVGKPISHIYFEWDAHVLMRLYHVEYAEEPQALNSHSELRWVDPREAIKWLPMAPSSYLFYQDVVRFMSGGNPT